MISETVLSGLSKVVPWLIAIGIVLCFIAWIAKMKTRGSKVTRLFLILLCAFLLMWMVKMMLNS